MNSFNPDEDVIIRELQGNEEMVRAEALQKSVWESTTDYDHKDILIAMQHAGGLVAGAFTRDGTLIGFILAFPTMVAHGLHSHRLAVVATHRRFHIGEKLKWFQHDWAVNHDIRWIQWTFDPLQVINAYLNIHRLGAIANEYFVNYYGSMDGINSGTPSDRILAIWHLNSPRVKKCHNNIKEEEDTFNVVSVNQVRNNKPCHEKINQNSQFLRINLPQNYTELGVNNKNLALDWRLHVRSLLLNYFSLGYCVSDFTKRHGPAYILQPYSDLAKELL